MAHSQHAAAKHRSRRRHQTRTLSPSRHHDWDSRHPTNPHSLPYRPRQPEIRRPAGWSSNYYSHRAALVSDEDDEDDDFEVDIPDPMPHPQQQQQLTRSGGASARNGKGRAVFLEVEEDDEDEEQDRMISRLRSRSRPRTQSRSRIRSRAQSKARSETSSGDDETYELSTPPRSTPVYRSRPTSRLPSPSSSRSSSVDSDSTTSSQDMRLQRRARSKRPSEVPVTPPPPPPAVDRAERRRHRQRQRDRSAYRDESDDDDEPEFDNRIRLRARSKSVPRQPTRNMDSRSSSMRRTYRLRSRDRYDEGGPSSSSKRPHHRRRYYESDAVYAEKPALPRAHTAPSSHVTSQSMSSSSRRSSTFLNRFMGPGLQSPPDKHSKMVECVVCLDDVPASETAKLKCKHRMCKSCLKRSFKLSVKDPAQMPPRCCKSECIPVKHVEALFKDDFKKTWNRKFHEFSTRNRVYCPGKRCGQWIRPDQIQRHQNGRRVGKCGSCQTRVCCDCNNRWHGSGPCPMDEEMNQFLQQAKEEGWQRCYNCRNMVELKEGCNHMTCRCGAEFCMICGLKWRTCECPWFSYDGPEIDHLDPMQIPEPVIDRERLNLRSAPPPAIPGMDTRRRSPGNGLRNRLNPFEDERLLRRFQQEQQDEELARRLQFEDTEDDYMSPEDIGGNHTAHFPRNEYRRRAQTVVAPPAPAPPPVAPFDRANSVIDYVAGVNRARGVGNRANSMERRLADRFEQRQNNSPAQHSFGLPIPPPPAPPRAMGPPPIPQVPLGQPPMLSRRHTVDDDLYDSPRANRIPERMLPRRASTRGYVDEPAFYEPAPRARRRERAASTSPKDSVLAGLTGPGRGMHRVYEWVNHVEPDPLTT
ncbi:uncharacterized protein F4807DRAFT_471364 [Annulohypoxylon truncatum]|uniref:uncharacterized protein n=1 Tax=Annulohypoxylon truncatum TaxID=327061 RepID=UPI0020078692|nr:uncharacterized protein F4807DRAFT_471364 [Annulohypoxylon truncatum]KAI1204906.1 hypothetical protein F4807DRAFT_471364 [Annulohypoxylon truncatum]